MITLSSPFLLWGFWFWGLGQRVCRSRYSKSTRHPGRSPSPTQPTPRAPLTSQWSDPAFRHKSNRDRHSQRKLRTKLQVHHWNRPSGHRVAMTNHRGIRTRPSTPVNWPGSLGKLPSSTGAGTTSLRIHYIFNTPGLSVYRCLAAGIRQKTTDCERCSGLRTRPNLSCPPPWRA